MKNESRNHLFSHDTLINGGLIASGIVGLLLTVLQPEISAAAPQQVAAVVLSETAAV